ncbi:hypothetical protein [Desulfoferrobacter suflitae]|uniref:hypothetical protein n=1 Tax=Desulfoferrobacter suflitae TaxID=2865782 RepID=UPI00216417A4|nr:hypothetical protein [Desulfoferrobacter suflitae]MCK8603934.1 hypothetical protein [Desulfoferrobacter suflitae]
MTIGQDVTAEKLISRVPLAELREAITNEYRRRVIRYKMIDEAMKRKYRMNFVEFESRNMVSEEGYSWEAESDAMEWEHAVEGIRYARNKLEEFENL